MEDYRNRLEKIAYDLAILMANPIARQSLYSQIAESKYLENKVDLGALSIALSSNLSSLSLSNDMSLALNDLSVQAQYFTENNISIDVYFPVKEHRKVFLENPATELLVAYDPIDEQARQIVAFYPNGSKVYLSPERPPNIPTLIVAISEGRFERSSITSIETCELNTTYMKYIRVYDIKEPWFKGDPEIYCWVVYENGFKKKLYWPEINRTRRSCYLDCTRPIIDQWSKDEFEHVAFIWYEKDVSFPVKCIKIKLPWGYAEIEIGDIIIDRDDEMGSEIADWDAVPWSPYDSGKPYNTGIVEFRIAGKCCQHPKTTPTPAPTLPWWITNVTAQTTPTPELAPIGTPEEQLITPIG